MNLRLNLLLLIFGIGLVTQSAWSNNVIEIVTDPWPPYVYAENNKVVGTDVEVTQAVLKRMGLTADFQLLPWKRCLSLVENKRVDAILAVSVTGEREKFLHFPSEPVSRGITVFFIKAEDPISSINLDNPQNLNVGAMLGYEYCDELDNSRLMAGASRVPTLEQNFNMLLSGRIDLAVAIELVGYHKASKMGISDQLAVVGNERYCPGGNYLAFAQKPGYEKLATRFGEELIKFKATDAYQRILAKYLKPQ
ncbi:MAG: transporter substrate-binding domain-containing protein [Pseudomonadales bacterium]|nr:transporter substrate-binding domain-containing protein [Pseudomonadales bacterium]